MSLILDGVLLTLPGVETRCYADDPAIPQATDGSRRRKADVAGVVIHTVTAHPYQPPVLPGSRPSEHAERLARYQANTARKVSWHYTVDTDGTVVQSADVASWTCWHATAVNGWTVGIEMVQEADGTLYRPQLAAVVALCDVLCAHLHIDRRVPARNGVPIVGVVPRLTGHDGPWSGVFGHRHQTHNRGPGDPGDYPFLALLAAGYLGVEP